MKDDTQREFDPDFVVISLDKEGLAKEFKRRVFFKEDKPDEERDNEGTRDLENWPD